MSDEARNEGVAALRQGAGALLRPELLTVRARGSDRVRFLNGMLSNDVSRIGVGEAQRAVKASSKGRVEGVLRLRARESELLLDLREVSAGRVAGELVKFLVMDDVQLEDVSKEREVVSVHGPEAARVVRALGYERLPERHLTFVEAPGAVIVRDDDFGLESYELHVADGSRTLEALERAGARRVEMADLDVVRVEAGRPLDGVDVDTDTIPLEARLDEAIDHEKGCYIGQEVIARATHRGGVKHHLVGLAFEGPPPPAGAALWPLEGAKATGELTSAVFSPTLGRAIGLGYVRVDHEAPGTPLEVRAPDGSVARATVAALPHVDA